jgi:hypothetical protein
MAAQIGDRQKTAHLLQHEIGFGQDMKVKDYAKTAGHTRDRRGQAGMRRAPPVTSSVEPVM